MKNLTDFQGFLIKEGDQKMYPSFGTFSSDVWGGHALGQIMQDFNFKENKLKKDILNLLTKKDHTEMFLFITAHKDWFDTIENLSTKKMVEKLTSLLYRLDPLLGFKSQYPD
jgi:hypothetical protein